MFIILVRAAVLYITVIILLRLMGKRQIGELSPSEFVITMLVSEIAAIPMQDNSIPILNSLAALLVLVALEIIISFINLKSSRISGIIQGHPVTVIRNGSIDMKALGELRMTLGDLLEALRQKDVFDISDVAYAILETNGKISVLLKPELRNATVSDVNAAPQGGGMTFAVICDGKFIKENVAESGKSEEYFISVLKARNISVNNILLMTADESGNIKITEKR